MSDQTNLENPSMAKVLKDLIEAKMLEVNTHIPGQFVSYDASKNLAQVRPVLQRKKNDGTLITPPVINNVPVMFPRAGKAILKFPIHAGDACWLMFSQRSLDTWKLQGGISDPADTRHHHIADAVAYPGGYPNTDQIAGETTDLVLMNDKAEVRLEPGGKMSLKNLTSGDELIALVNQMADLLSTTTVNTIFGPMKLNDFATFAIIKGKLDNLKV